MQKFVNRAKELESLEKQYATDQSSLVIVYGRRRVGKTALITEFLKRHSNSLYFLATEESEMQNLNWQRAFDDRSRGLAHRFQNAARAQNKNEKDNRF